MNEDWLEKVKFKLEILNDPENYMCANDAIDLAQDFASYLDDALRHIKKIENPWQTIDTAPKDGTEIVCFDGLNYFVAKYGSESRGVSLSRGEEFWDGFISQEGMQDPKHWMPLPKIGDKS